MLRRGRLLARRAAAAALTLLAVAVLASAAVRLLPGDVVTQLLGAEGKASAARQAELRRFFGVDQPLPVQIGRSLNALARGDLGRSLRTGRPVAADLWERVPVTAELAVLSLGAAALLAVPAGVLLAVARGPLGRALTGLLSVGLAVPPFFLAILLSLLFSLRLRLLPPSGYVPLSVSVAANVRHMLLPAATLGLLLFCVLCRTARGAVAEVLARDHVKVARAKGLPEWQVLLRHALRPAALPIATVIGLEMASLLSGAVLVEQVFGLPGVGRYALEGVALRDYPVVLGVTLFVAAAVVLVNMGMELLYVLLDPRLRAPDEAA